MGLDQGCTITASAGMLKVITAAAVMMETTEEEAIRTAFALLMVAAKAKVRGHEIHIYDPAADEFQQVTFGPPATPPG